jgi:hypothetical protein
MKRTMMTTTRSMPPTTTTTTASGPVTATPGGRAIRLGIVMIALMAAPVMTAWLTARAASGEGDPDAKPQAVAAAPSEAVGAEARPPASAPGPRGPMSIGPAGRFGRPGTMFPPLSQQEIQETATFFRDHAPNRYALFEQLDEGFPRRRVLRVMVNRYRQIQRFKDNDQEMYNLAVKQFELQDEAFGIIRNVAGTGNPDAETLSKLRDKVKELAQLGLKEREKRVERLERMLAEEKSRLEADKADPDALVDRQLRQIRNEADEVKRHLDQLQDFQRGRDERGSANTPSTAPSNESR